MKKRIKEICGKLDADIYWKGCNFLENENDDEIPTFYSRDDCRSISFRELLLWYLPRLGSWQDEPNWCPLKELPDEIHSKEYLDEYCDGYDDGWNSLRKKILCEDEENK